MLDYSCRPAVLCGRQCFALGLLLIAAGVAIAQTLAPVTEQEIASLFVTLKSSGCEFFRNGSWHSADAAASHLQRKYNHLLKEGLLTTTESFIELAATESSMSGKPYLVRCGKAEPIPSKTWFTDKLVELRGT